MSLLVVPLAADEAGTLSLDEWDALRTKDRVLFEDPSHPLLARLAEEGVDAAPFDDEPPADRTGWAAVVDPSSPRVVELARAGAEVTTGASRAPDPLTAAHGASIGRRAASAVGELALVMARLRSADGCPWDLEQSHESLQVHLLEEAYEVLETIFRGAVGAELEEELGDLLLQVVFHAQLAADDGRFDLASVARRLVAKLIRRHPHVFGTTRVSGAHEVVRNWEAIKKEEKERAGTFEDVPAALPALLTTYKVQKRAAGRGFDASGDEALDRARAALEGATDADGLGDALFWLVAVARARGVEPEGALRRATARFVGSLG